MNVKPVDLQTQHNSKEEKKKRQEAEQKLKGDTIVNITPPNTLSANGKKIYKNIINILPGGFLNSGDVYIVCIIADALDNIELCQKNIKKNGLIISNKENPSISIYKKYTDIFNTYSMKIGLSPRDRAQLSVLNINAESEKNDEVLKALRGDDS